jgi:glyceraldehyde-3-phosphate dehydrogenase (NADP+)
LKNLENKQSTFEQEQGIIGQIRRSPYGVVLCSGPFNYPFNETYTTLIPALIMGNSVVMKLPRYGVLCHFPTLEIFQRVFPKGVINVISGSGRATMPACMTTGLIDIFAFIGTSTAADAIQKVRWLHLRYLNLIFIVRRPTLSLTDCEFVLVWKLRIPPSSCQTQILTPP